MHLGTMIKRKKNNEEKNEIEKEEKKIFFSVKEIKMENMK